MKRHFPASCLIAILTLPLLIGCGPSASARLLGKWELDATKSIDDASADKDKLGADLMAGMMKELAKTIKIEVEFKPGNAMTVTAPTILGASVTKDGTWRVSQASGNDVTIARKMEGDSAEQETKVKFVDNDTVEMIPPADSPRKTPATFRRVKKT